MAGDSIFVTGASGFIGGAPTRALGKARPEIGYEPVITVEHGLEELAAA
jgi:uncharacterized protein YbjT (DUF2867 family)